MAAAPWIVSDELWELIEPLLPRKERRFRYPGRKRLPDRQALRGILFVLHTGVAWQHLPAELGFGSGVTCWRRLDEWQPRGVRAAALALARAPAGGRRDRVGASDRRLEPGPSEKGAPRRGRARSTGAVPAPSTIYSSTNRGSRSPSRSPVRTANVTQLIPLLDPVPPVGGLVGRPRRRPDCVIADRGYDHDKFRRLLRQRGIEPVIARRQTEHGSGLGRYRWVVERTGAWLNCYRRLRIRYERRDDIHQALLDLGCALICWNFLQRGF